MSVMTVQDAVIEKLNKLPIPRQKEVLDFAEFLEQKETITPRVKRPRNGANVDRISAEENELVAAGLMSLPTKERNDDFLKLPAPKVSTEAVRAAIRVERDED